MNKKIKQEEFAKEDFISSILELLIIFIKKSTPSDIIFQKREIIYSSFSNKPPYNKSDYKIDFDFKKSNFILEIQNNPSSFFEEKFKLNKISDEEIEMYLDELTEKGYLKKNNKTISRTQCTERITNYLITLKPFIERTTKPYIFYAMQFHNKITFEFYKMLKKEIQKQLKLDVVMLGEDKKSGNLHIRIKNEIRDCKFFIGDLTSNTNNYNPNVMYELGMASGFNKKCLQIINEDFWDKSQEFSKEILPFDISSHNTLKYSSDKKEWKEDIKEIIKTIKSSI